MPGREPRSSRLLATTIATLVCLGLSLPCTTAAALLDQPLDLEALGGEESWQVISHETGGDGGRLWLHHDYWQMHFLHWRPLSPERQKLSREVARELLLSFWGERMGFSLTGAEGRLEVAGHRAYWVEGTLLQGMVLTRFFVWNCPDSGRQLISELSTSRRRETGMDVLELLELQHSMVETISCHSQAPAPAYPESLPAQEVVLERYGLSYRIPAGWRSREYPRHDWYPEGISADCGSLWTLPTDSERQVQLLWHKDTRVPSPELLAEYLQELQPPVTIDTGVTLEISQPRLDWLSGEAGRCEASGSYDLLTGYGQEERSQRFLFRAVLWKQGERIFLLLGGVVAVQEHWRIANDLTPQPEVIERFVCQDLIPALRTGAEPGPVCRPMVAYLQPTALIDSDHPEIVAAAARATAGCKGDVERARALVELVRRLEPPAGAPARGGAEFDTSHLDQECASETASDTLRCAEDSCYARSRLLVALARSLGIPARLQLQRVSIDGFQWRDGDREDLVYAHVTTGLFLDGRWQLAETLDDHGPWLDWSSDRLWGRAVAAAFSPASYALLASDSSVRVELLPIHFADWSPRLLAEIEAIDGGRFLEPLQTVPSQDG